MSQQGSTCDESTITGNSIGESVAFDASLLAGINGQA
eukprot:CAMPEP_0202460644 /NCGR_PEP_ID=MMETSP1360-20130828/45124_1 /ASSEMBLY_ACC=CAM_ASM_000848 /TAXON_ID=515479 /ORGANISM="Licmophora paradoxa, Strain CCMP2313" /LENGTH=36 /DNA_ID= /DNA_START= /DNA_END= /DNA_ORIENTATION=